MTVHDRRLSSEGYLHAKTRAIRALDGPEILQLARRLVVFTPHGKQIAALMGKARKAIPMLTTAEIVRRVASHNPDCFWAISRRGRFDIAAPEGEGYFALLPLTEKGLRGLLDGSLDRKNPSLSCVAPQNEQAAALYIWHVYAPGPLAVGITLACRKLWTLQNQKAHVYGWATNPKAIRFFEGIGFRRLPKRLDTTAPQFHVFERPTSASAGQNEQTVTARVPSAPPLSVRVARSIEDFMQAVSIRGAVYIGEQYCPYDEEFDGNDFSATHLIGYVGAEPAGCMRIRYFAQFAKVERLVVRKEFRSSGLARYIVRAGVELCERKGYERVCVYAQRRLTRFWSKCGFELPDQPRELVFSDYDYVEMICRAEPASNAISAASNPYVVIRPEGSWDGPGVLEQSSARGVRAVPADERAA